MLLLDFIYINDSGGKVLLQYLTQQISENGVNCFYLLDKRVENDFPQLSKDKVAFLPASENARKLFYKSSASRFTKILCFANVPPPIKLNVPVFTYFHNLLLLKQPKGFPIRVKISVILKYIYIRFRLKNTDYFVVQSDNVQKEIMAHLSFPAEKILTLPFFRSLGPARHAKSHSNKFCYVSNGNSHKNHINLLKAWKILKARGLDLELNLTISDKYPALLKVIEHYQNQKLKIINHTNADVKKIYEESDFQIYPSTIESFGLPLIESAEAGCEVIASDLSYVHAIIQPLEVFDPYNPNSIADAVVLGIQKKQRSLNTKIKVKNKIEELISLLKS